MEKKKYLSPIALDIKTAATVLSTPPETAPMTFPLSPQIERILSISLSTKDSFN